MSQQLPVFKPVPLVLKEEQKTERKKSFKYYYFFYLISIVSIGAGYYFYQHIKQINDMFIIYLVVALLLFLLGRVASIQKNYEDLNYEYHEKINERFVQIQTAMAKR